MYKDKYHRLERKIERVFKWFAVIFAVPMLFVYVKIMATKKEDLVN